MRTHPIAVVANIDGFVVLCEDGTVFALTAFAGKWTTIEPLARSRLEEASRQRELNADITPPRSNTV